MEYERIYAAENQKGDFAVLLEDDSLAPHVRRGETVFLERRVDLQNGDIGLFYDGERLVFRQFCEDCFGNVYLLSPDRTQAEADAMFPHDGEMPVCYGKVLLKKPVPLP